MLMIKCDYFCCSGLEKELAALIASKQITARIDSHAKAGRCWRLCRLLLLLLLSVVGSLTAAHATGQPGPSGCWRGWGFPRPCGAI